MSKRREPGDGSIFYEESRERWVAVADLGRDGRGKRVRKKVTGKTKTEVRKRLAEILRDHEEDLLTVSDITVAEAMSEWLEFGLSRTSDSTKSNYETLSRNHIVGRIGAYKLRNLKATQVDRWLAELAPHLSTRSLRLVHSLLVRAINHAMARDLAKRNVAELVRVPEGRPGRPSRSLTLEQARAIIDQAEGHPFYAYVVVSLLTGARTEEVRALTWAHTHLDGDPNAEPPLPPYLEVWRSVRAGNDTKTRRSRRTIALPARCVDVLCRHQAEQLNVRAAAGGRWHDLDLVFCSSTGNQMDATSARRAFRRAIDGVAGIDPAQWTPRELRHSFVSILSDQRIPLEEISRLVGHSSTNVTETVYRHQIRPVLSTGSTAIDHIFED